MGNETGKRKAENKNPEKQALSLTIPPNWTTPVYLGLMALILLSGLWLRTNDLLAWRNAPGKTFYNNQPILIAFDGYYYLSLARDLAQDGYAETDLLRGAPEPPPRPMPPPLISVVAATLARLTPFSLEWIATLLPAVFGVLVAWPLCLMSRLYGGRAMAIVSVGMALYAYYYAYRTNVGFFDTDCLNTTFVMLICYFFIQFGLGQNRDRYKYLFFAAATYLFFLLWWDQTPAVVTLVTLSTLGVVVVLYYRPHRKERRIVLAIVAVCALGVLSWKGIDSFLTPFESALSSLNYISKQHTSDFPSASVSVSEQTKPSISQLVRLSTGHWFSFLAGFAGLALLVVRTRKKALPLIIPFAVGALSFFFARRFLVFLNPFLALGCGYLIQQVWTVRRHILFSRIAATALALIFLSIPFVKTHRVTHWPKIEPPLISGMHKARQAAPENAVVWSWWDLGYPLNYYAQRATISDGSLHGGLNSVCNAFPLVVDNERLAANFILFYTHRGNSGLQKLFRQTGGAIQGMRLLSEILGGSEEQSHAAIEKAGLTPVLEWRGFFFPRKDRDVFLYLDLIHARTSYWWHWFGTWDIEKRQGVHAKFHFYPKHKQLAGIMASRGIKKKKDLGDGDKRDQSLFRTPDGMIVNFDNQTQAAAIADASFMKTVFYQLYVTQYSRTGHFKLISSDFPYYQLWQVKSPPETQHTDGLQVNPEPTKKTLNG